MQNLWPGTALKSRDVTAAPALIITCTINLRLFCSLSKYLNLRPLRGWLSGFRERRLWKFACVRATAPLEFIFQSARARRRRLLHESFTDPREASRHEWEIMCLSPLYFKFTLRDAVCAATRMKFNNCTNKTSANQHGKCPLGAHALQCALHWKYLFNIHFSTPRQFQRVAATFRVH